MYRAPFSRRPGCMLQDELKADSYRLGRTCGARRTFGVLWASWACCCACCRVSCLRSLTLTVEAGPRKTRRLARALARDASAGRRARYASAGRRARDRTAVSAVGPGKGTPGTGGCRRGCRGAAPGRVARPQPPPHAGAHARTHATRLKTAIRRRRSAVVPPAMSLLALMGRMRPHRQSRFREWHGWCNKVTRFHIFS